MTRNVTRALPITWADATWEVRAGGGLRFVMPVVEATNRVSRIGRGRAYKTSQGRENVAGAQCAFRRCYPLTGDLVARIVWFRAQRAGDTDGRIKQCLDLLQGLAYPDDKQIADVRIYRIDDPRERPRMVVDIRPLDRPLTLNDLEAA